MKTRFLCVSLGLSLTLAVCLVLGFPAFDASAAPEADYWVMETVDTDDAGSYNSIALDSSGYPHISYHHPIDYNNSALKYAYKDVSGWNIETVEDSGMMGKYTSIKVDTSNYPHISYYDDSADNLRYAYKTATGWFSETVESAGAVGLYTSLALDGSDLPHISYMHSSSTNRLKYAYKDGGGWHPEIVDTTSMNYSSISVDGNGNPHIAYHPTSLSQAKYAYKDGVTWHFEIIDGETSSVGEGISLVMEPTTPYTPHVSYYDRSSGTIEHAYRTASGWITETVDNVSCLNTSIALDGNGYPHVSYYRYVSSVTRDLKYAYRTASGWITKTVDSGGNQGFYSAIAVDGDGHPHISYLDGSNSDLEYAYVMTPPPPTDRYVDHNGACNGYTPCYTTIGAAVTASYPGDTIYVFPGIYAESVDLSTMIVPSDISFITVDATGTLSPGTVTVNPAASGGPNTGPAFYNSTSPFSGDVTINGFNVTSPDDDGIDLVVNSEIVIANVTANDTADDGVDVIAQTGSITVTNSTANNNGGTDGNGFYLEATIGNVTVISSTANSNTGSDNNDGFETSAGGDVIVIASSADGNSEEGIDIESAGGNVTITDCSADGNGGEGLDLDYIEGNVVIESCTATGNGSDGIEGKTNIAGNMTINNCAFNQNDSDGMDISVQTGSITVTNSIANNNGGGGEYTDGLDLTAPAGNVTIINVTANNNIGSIDNDGIEVGQVGGDIVVSNCTVIGNSEDGFDLWDVGGTVTVDASIARNNGDDGVWLNSGATGLTVRDSIICNNDGSGLWLNIAMSMNAEGNWWGAATGPYHATNNPAGAGNAVVDGASGGGAGAVDFIPWIDTISGSAPPAVPGDPTIVRFQFSDAAGTGFLGQGPGNPNDSPPFTLTTDNGVLTSSTGTGVTVTEFINNPNGVLTVTLTPAITGTATVTLDGPCNLDGVLVVQTWIPTDWIYLPLVVRN